MASFLKTNVFYLLCIPIHWCLQKPHSLSTCQSFTIFTKIFKTITCTLWTNNCPLFAKLNLMLGPPMLLQGVRYRRPRVYIKCDFIFTPFFLVFCRSAICYQLFKNTFSLKSRAGPCAGLSPHFSFI
jgi:hypothetical protein